MLSALIIDGPSATGKSTAASAAATAVLNDYAHVIRGTSAARGIVHSTQLDSCSAYANVASAVARLREAGRHNALLILDRCFLSNCYPESDRFSADYDPWPRRAAFWSSVLDIDHLACIVTLPFRAKWYDVRAEVAVQKDTNGLRMYPDTEADLWAQTYERLGILEAEADTICPANASDTHGIAQTSAAFDTYCTMAGPLAIPAMQHAVHAAMASLPDWTTSGLLTFWRSPKPYTRKTEDIQWT